MRCQETADRYRLGFVAVAVIALALVSGCGLINQDPGAGNASPTDAQSPAPSPPASQSPSSAQEGLDVLAARDAALQRYPEALVHELDLEDDGQMWEIELIHEDSEIEIAVNTVSGAITVQGRDDDDDDDLPSGDLSTLSTDSLDAAVSAALQERESGREDGRVTEASLDEDDGRLVWEIEVDDSYTVDVDAKTGEVIEVET